MVRCGTRDRTPGGVPPGTRPPATLRTLRSASGRAGERAGGPARPGSRVVAPPQGSQCSRSPRLPLAGSGDAASQPIRPRNAAIALVWIALPLLGLVLPLGRDTQLAEAYRDVSRSGVDTLVYLLLDEPFSGLDLATKEQLLGDIRVLAQERGITAVLVTHDPIEALALCGRAVLLDGGVVAESGPWREALHEPRSRILQLFAVHMRPPGA